jgi:hypothetical protein
MTTGALFDEAALHGAEVAALARRVAAIPWFEPMRRDAHLPTRLAAAILRHEVRLGFSGPPRPARILDTAAARAVLLAPAGEGSNRWRRALDEQGQRLHRALRGRPELAQHPLLEWTGEALLLRTAVLPVPQARLRTRLAGPAEGRPPAAVIQCLVDRVLWEVGTAVAWPLGGPTLGPSPFDPLLDIYEEGLYPLDLGGAEIILWNPASGLTAGRGA